MINKAYNLEYKKQKRTVLFLKKYIYKDMDIDLKTNFKFLFFPLHKIFDLKKGFIRSNKYEKNTNKVVIKIFSYVNKFIASQAMKQFLSLLNCDFVLHKTNINKTKTFKYTDQNKRRKKTVINKRAIFTFKFKTEKDNSIKNVDFIQYISSEFINKRMKSFLDKEGSDYIEFLKLNE